MRYRTVNKADLNSTLFFYECDDLPISRIISFGFTKVLKGKNLSKVDYVVMDSLDMGKQELYKIFKPYKGEIVLIEAKDLYKQTCTETIDKELFNTLDSLLKNRSLDNTRIALELMSKILWKENTFYLMELYNIHKDNIHHYKSNLSTNVKYFIDNFIDQRKYSHLYRPENYYKTGLVKTLEHSNYIQDKHLESFQISLYDLFIEYGVELKNLDFTVKGAESITEPKVKFKYDEISKTLGKNRIVEG